MQAVGASEPFPIFPSPVAFGKNRIGLDTPKTKDWLTLWQGGNSRTDLSPGCEKGCAWDWGWAAGCHGTASPTDTVGCPGLTPVSPFPVNLQEEGSWTQNLKGLAEPPVPDLHEGLGNPGSGRGPPEPAGCWTPASGRQALLWVLGRRVAPEPAQWMGTDLV